MNDLGSFKEAKLVKIHENKANTDGKILSMRICFNEQWNYIRLFPLENW